LRVIIAPLTLAIAFYPPFRLFLDHLACGSGHGRAKDAGSAKISLTLCGLETEIMTVLCVEHFYFACASQRKSFA
jgi:hypothetical protein